ncbi:acyl-CoA dehydrogenase family protein [Streptacidiphilus carbonis]|uniref:acyl-CoA dehydrogenase family protein n=1 Tax=Streptacidiphilus carbonis TaxID=105422 RepID=UPI0005A8020F|nr:acyl-CoA dehydrogenase family protein [Streptacidiphilus carbonis]
MSYQEKLSEAITNVIEPAARLVDREGKFPRDGVTALGAAGILGLTVPTSHGGAGAGLAEAADAVRRVSGACGSTAMVLTMHFAATAVLTAHGPDTVVRAIAEGRHLTTLAFSENGSRSHFWAPVSTARTHGDSVILEAQKSWVTSASQADSYVWSSRPLTGEGPMTLWLVSSDAPGLSIPFAFDGLGLRGNASSPVTADSVRVAPDARLGEDGTGLDIAFGAALPYFLILNAACSVGQMEAVIARTITHLTGSKLEHLGQTLAEQSGLRQGLARMRITADSARVLLDDTVAALAAGREDAQLRLLEVKAAAAEAAIEVTDLAMTVCGGSAFRTDLGIERSFRDARAARVMAPTTEALRDFIGRALCGLPLM